MRFKGINKSWINLIAYFSSIIASIIQYYLNNYKIMFVSILLGGINLGYVIYFWKKDKEGAK